MVKLFSPPYGDGTTTPKYPVMDDAFPSPCGDKLKFMTQLKILNYAQAFPSPCGDKLKWDLLRYVYTSGTFPSPCGAAPLYHGGGTIEIPFQGEP